MVVFPKASVIVTGKPPSLVAAGADPDGVAVPEHAVRAKAVAATRATRPVRILLRFMFLFLSRGRG